jgi:hypothetical protein
MPCSISIAARSHGRRSSQIASSSIMKSEVAWQLSALEAARPVTWRNGVPSSGLPLGLSSGPSCMTAPVGPVDAIRIDCSSFESGEGEFGLSQLSGPASIETPCATRRVRRSCRQAATG